MKTLKKKKIERRDLGMARRPKGNYSASVKNMTMDTISFPYNYNVKWKDTIRKKKAARKLKLKHICIKTVNSYYRKTP